MRLDRRLFYTLAVTLGVFPAPVILADDTEIYFSDIPAEQGIANVLFVLDYSGSMAKAPDGNDAAEGRSRYDLMRGVFDNVLADLPKNISAGVMPYGGQANPAQANGIQYPVRVLTDEQRKGITDTLDSFTVGGYTPIVQSLYEAALYFRGADAFYGNSLDETQQSHPEALLGGFQAVEQPPVEVVRQCNEGLECDDLGVALTNCRTLPATDAGSFQGNGDQCIGGYDEAGVCLAWNKVTIPEPAQPERRVCDYTTTVTRLVPDYTYQSPVVGECQANYIVLLSDGEPDDGLAGSDNVIRERVASLSGSACSGTGDGVCGPELTRYLATTDQSPLGRDQTVKTFAIGFANTGGGNAYLESLANLGGDDTQAFYRADNEAELIRAFTEIIDNIAGQTRSLLPPTLSLESAAGTGKDVFMPLFRPSLLPRWSGNLKRFTLGENNQLPLEPQDEWNLDEGGESVRDGGAASLLGTQRNLYTSSTTGQLMAISAANVSATDLGLEGDAQQNHEAIIRFARGLEPDSGLPRKAMGDILHSRPLLVSYESGDRLDGKVLFVGTNEGYLHAFNADSGEELFAFMPRELLPNLPRLFTNDPEFAHPYGMDGLLTVWKTDDGKIYLFAGMRRGGRNYYALDVTNPKAPKLQWVIRGGQGDFDLLGQSWSKPVKTKVELKRGTPIRDVLVFGGGYDPEHDDETCKLENVEWADCPLSERERLEPHGRRADSIGRKLFFVDAITGELLWSAGSDHSSDLVLADMVNAIPATPAVVDLDNNGIADRIYAADLGGRVFRIDLPDSTNRLMSDDVDFDYPVGGLFANLNDGRTETNRRFFNEPDVSLISQGLKRFLAISIGSGYRAHPLDKGVVEDRLYMLKDFDVNSLRPANAAVLADGSLEDVSNNISSTHANGWYLRLDAAGGEKALARAQTINGTVFFTTFIPTEPPADVLCEPVSHQAAIYSIDLRTASAPPHFTDGEEVPSQTLRRHLVKTGDILPEVSLLVAPQSDGTLNIDTFVGGDFTPTSTVKQGQMVIQGVSKVYWEEER